MFVQLEVTEHVTGYTEYDLMKNEQIGTAALNYPPSVLKTVGLVSFTMLLKFIQILT